MGSRMTAALVGAALWLWAPAAMSYRQSDCGYYANTNGGSVGRQCSSTMQAPPPQRVTAICRDQTYSYEPGSGACWEQGGVQTWLH